MMVTGRRNWKLLLAFALIAAIFVMAARLAEMK